MIHFGLDSRTLSQQACFSTGSKILPGSHLTMCIKCYNPKKNFCCTISVAYLYFHNCYSCKQSLTSKCYTINCITAAATILMRYFHIQFTLPSLRINKTSYCKHKKVGLFSVFLQDPSSQVAHIFLIKHAINYEATVITQREKHWNFTKLQT